MKTRKHDAVDEVGTSAPALPATIRPVSLLHRFATNTVYDDAQLSSALILPIIPTEK